MEAADVEILVARTSSLAGNLQVVARSIETALHKLLELEFDVKRIIGGMGSAPLPPVAADDLTGIGRTNDAILYGAQVTLWVKGDDASLAEIGPKVPSSASESFGKPFLQIFEEAGRDFYRVDRLLFSPAEIVFQNVDTGGVHCFGKHRHPGVAHVVRIARKVAVAAISHTGAVVHIAVLANRRSWYAAQLKQAARLRGHRATRIDFTRLKSGVCDGQSRLTCGDLDVSNVDAVIVRTMPPGSLEQVVYRMDVLLRWEAAGVTVLKSSQGD